MGCLWLNYRLVLKHFIGLGVEQNECLLLGHGLNKSRINEIVLAHLPWFLILRNFCRGANYLIEIPSPKVHQVLLNVLNPSLRLLRNDLKLLLQSL